MGERGGGGGYDSNNLKNAVIAFLALLPSLLFYFRFLYHHENGGHHDSIARLSPLWKWCYDHPLLLATTLFFLNVNLLFWLISQLQSSHWMISLYWPVIPVMLAHYFATHPSAQEYNRWRSWLVIPMTWVWSIRLGHSYFRRERWQWGAREDWRFSAMRRQYGRHFWWASFFVVYLAQQILLTGITMPLYIIHSVDKPLNLSDLIALVVCMSGITIAYYADTQLHNFRNRNDSRKEPGRKQAADRDQPILNKGLWGYCRHPNYLGEQLWWWGLFLFSWNLGCGHWAFIGPVMNSLSLTYVTKIVEDKMVKEEYRAEAYREYQQTTLMWIPWFKFNSSSFVVEKDKET